MFGLYLRWRHTRGYGIHSPFAYRLVTEAVKPPRRYAYYAELEPGMTPARRLAHRVGVFVRQTTGRTLADRFTQWAADPSAPLLITDPDQDTRAGIADILRRENCGLLLNSRKFIFAIARKEMAFTEYDIL